LKECELTQAILLEVCEMVSEETRDIDRPLAEVASWVAGQLSGYIDYRHPEPDILSRPNILLARALEKPEDNHHDELKAADVPALVATLICIRCAISAHVLVWICS